MGLGFNPFPMCPRNLIYNDLCLPFFLLPPSPLFLLLSLLFFLSQLLFPDFEFLKRIHLGHVRLISFLGLVCAALLFFSTC